MQTAQPPGSPLGILLLVAAIYLVVKSPKKLQTLGRMGIAFVVTALLFMVPGAILRRGDPQDCSRHHEQQCGHHESNPHPAKCLQFLGTLHHQIDRGDQQENSQGTARRLRRLHSAESQEIANTWPDGEESQEIANTWPDGDCNFL